MARKRPVSETLSTRTLSQKITQVQLKKWPKRGPGKKKSTPAPCSPVYIIQGLSAIDEAYVAFFALLPDKTSAMYKELFEQIANLIRGV